MRIYDLEYSITSKRSPCKRELLGKQIMKKAVVIKKIFNRFLLMTSRFSIHVSLSTFKSMPI